MITNNSIINLLDEAMGYLSEAKSSMEKNKSREHISNLIDKAHRVITEVENMAPSLKEVVMRDQPDMEEYEDELLFEINFSEEYIIAMKLELE